MAESGNLVKLKIIAIPTIDASPGGGGFEAFINPEHISMSKEIQMANQPVGNTAGSASQIQGYNNDTLTFDLYFDGTGVAAGSGGSQEEVDAMIDALDKVIFKYEGSYHRPNYLVVAWASWMFRCVCKTFTISYTMFKPSGAPLRAKVSLSLQGHIDIDTRKMQANNSSPDLSHVITVREGDRLPLLCKDVYGDYVYYQQVAEYNLLTNFRNLEVGSQLVFPPLGK